MNQRRLILLITGVALTALIRKEWPSMIRYIKIKRM